MLPGRHAHILPGPLFAKLLDKDTIAGAAGTVHHGEAHPAGPVLIAELPSCSCHQQSSVRNAVTLSAVRASACGGGDQDQAEPPPEVGGKRGHGR